MLIKMFNKCCQNVLNELCRSLCTTVSCPYFWTQVTQHKKLDFIGFELHTVMFIVKYLVSSDEAVPTK